MADETLGANDRATREQHIQHEQHLRAIGTLLVGAGLFLVLLAIALAVLLAMRPAADQSPSMSSPIAPFVEGCVIAFGGISLRSLQRWPVALLLLMCLVGLFVIPFGTVLSVWIFRVLFRGGTFIVLSPEYRRIVAATHEVARPRSRTPLILGLLATLQLLAMVGMYHLSLDRPPAEQAE